MSDEELDEEIERRRQAREEVGAAARGTTGRDAAPPRPSSAPPRRTAAGDEAIRKAYAALEVPAGSDFETVQAFVPAADAQVPPRSATRARRRSSARRPISRSA